MTPLNSSEVTLQVVVSLMMTLEVSFMLLDNIYSTGVTHDDYNLRSSYFHSTIYKLERPARDKHCNLSVSFISDGQKGFITLTPGWFCHRQGLRQLPRCLHGCCQGPGGLFTTLHFLLYNKGQIS